MPVGGIEKAPVLKNRVMFGAEVRVPMVDDGTRGDGAAGDGVFGAIVPASVAPTNQMIRWYIRATDTLGNVVPPTIALSPENDTPPCGGRSNGCRPSS